LRTYAADRGYTDPIDAELDDPIDAELDLENYRIKYNMYRPHEALEYDIPANYYKLDNLVRLTLNSK
jgi:hypothetical protein